MHFTALAVAPLPDIETARSDYRLHDLSDRDVAKVLFHRRKQRTGHEILDWDQQQLGAISMVRFGHDSARLETFSIAEFPEIMLIDAVFQIAQTAPPLVTWGGRRDVMPLLQFRSLKHRRALADYWLRVADDRDPHLDLQQAFLPDVETFPDLDAMCRRLGLPGMLGLRADALWERWQSGDREAPARFSETAAVNTALLGLEIFHLKGRYSLAEVDAWRALLRQALEADGRHGELLQAWGGDA